MRYKKIINLSGRYKFVRDACEDIYDYALSLPSLEGKIQILHSNPRTVDVTLRPFVNFYKASSTVQPNLIIHCFPYTTYKNLEDLNNYVDIESLNMFTKINLFVHEPHIIDSYRYDIMERRPIYTGLYCTSESYENKNKQIQKYLDL